MKPSYMELVKKKKSAEEKTSSKELELQSVSDSQIVQSNSFSNLDIDLYNGLYCLRIGHLQKITNMCFLMS